MSSHVGSSVGSVKRHGSMSSSHSQRGHHGEMPHHELSHTLPAHHHYESEWEAKEELRLRELEEARARAAQMEKTMRWWSDCTANWREKWSKVRTERNKAREEARLLRTKLETSLKDCNNLKREKADLENELDKLQRELDQSKLRELSLSNLPLTLSATPERDVPAFRNEPEKPMIDSVSDDTKAREDDENLHNESIVENLSQVPCPSDLPTSPDKIELIHTSPNAQNNISSSFQLTPDMEFLDKLLQPKLEKDLQTDSDIVTKDTDIELVCTTDNLRKDAKKKASHTKLIDDLPTPEQEYAEQRLSMLQLRLDEATKTIQAEREEKLCIHKTFEKLQQDLAHMKLKYEDLKQSKQEAIKELTQIKAEHQDELDSIRLDLEDEANSRSSMDRRLADLRAQLEALQAENAAEWGKRERLETEKLTLERENKKLRAQITELEERLERKHKQFSTASDSDFKALQQELHDKNKELADLKHAHNKLKKVLQDKTTELGHAIRRAEQYESEVKKLRARVEELKKELAAAEDEVDSATNNIRKLQRTNDELQEQVDSFQVQVEHLQTRLRSTNHSLLACRGTAGLLQADNLSEDDNTEY